MDGTELEIVVRAIRGNGMDRNAVDDAAERIAAMLRERGMAVGAPGKDHGAHARIVAVAPGR